MFLNCSARRLAAGVVLAALMMAAGCPTSSEKSEAVNSALRTTKPSPPAEPARSGQLPGSEFQNAAALPPAAPLPKPAVETGEPPKSDGTATSEKSEKSPQVANPLRDLKDLPPDEKIASEPSAGSPGKPTARSAPKPARGKHSGVPFDPIKENGPIFVGWPKPKVALVISGMEAGYLEPCGCAGLDRMKGGMGRRYTFFQQLRKEGWPIVGLDVGGIARGFGRQAELKFQTAVEAKRKTGYDAITFGAEDLRLPAGELVSVAASVAGKPSPFLSANVGLFGFAADITPTSRVIEAGGMRIGVTGILGKAYQKDIHNDEIEMLDPEAALRKVVPELKKKADYLVLLSHATMAESVALAQRFPEFNAIVVSDGNPEPPATPETVPGRKTPLITIGHKGMTLVVLGLYDDAQQPFRYQRVPLDSRFAGAPEIKLLMDAYQEQLKVIGFAGLGLRPVPHPLAETAGKFVGSKKCESCHDKSYRIWKKSGMTDKTGHAHSYETLAKLDPPRNFDPECVSCHVVGWHPTKFFPYESGYVSREKTPDLLDTGCEDCHGPGEKHCAAEIGANEELQKKYRKAAVITKAESRRQQCQTCHDLDNSPDFDFDAYWPFVEHYEKDQE